MKLFLFTVYGTVIGSFLNVCIYRIPAGGDIVRGRSRCPVCKAVIKPYDLIPVLSWFFLRGKCRSCGTGISPQYLFVEILTGVLFFLAAWRFETLYAVIMALFFSVLVVIAVIDFRHMTIPDGLNVSAAVLALAAFFLSGDGWNGLFDRLAGALAVSLPLWGLAVLTGGFGGGDIKLFAALGLMLGFKTVLLAAFLSFAAGGAVSALLLILKKIDRKSAVAFGPFICIGALAAALFGENLLGWYLGTVLTFYPG